MLIYKGLHTVSYKVYGSKVHEATWNSYCTLLVLEELNMQQESHSKRVGPTATTQPAGRGVCVLECERQIDRRTYQLKGLRNLRCRKGFQSWNCSCFWRAVDCSVLWGFLPGTGGREGILLGEATSSSVKSHNSGALVSCPH